MHFKTLILAAAIAGSLASAAGAAVTIDIRQVGADVVATASGTLDLDGLTNYGATNNGRFVIGRLGVVAFGPYDQVDGYGGLTGPAEFGTGQIVNPAIWSGGAFAVNGADGEVFVPPGFESGTAISDSETFFGHTLAKLGLEVGRYVYTAPNDTITVDISAVPEPASWVLMFGGIGLVGGMSRSAGARPRKADVAT
jgi:hypothetical protein